MSQTQQQQSLQPSQPYIPRIPPPGSLQEWMVRALAVRTMQNPHKDPGTDPADTQQRRIDEPATPPGLAEAPAEPDDSFEPAEPEQPPTSPFRVRLATELRRVQLTAQTALVRMRATGARTKVVVLVAVVAAVLAAGVGWQLSQAGEMPPASQPAIGALGATAAQSELTAPTAPTPVKPVAFGQVVKLNGWQVKIAGMKNSPQLKSVPGATSAAYPRPLGLSVTLVNTTDHAVAADGWVLSATVNGKPVQMIVHPPAGYVGVPHQTIQPGASMVFPVAVAMPTGRANLAIAAVNAQASLAMSFVGKG